jgi:hypothetical protein
MPADLRDAFAVAGIEPCSDGHCMFRFMREPGGMHTNGGCQHTKLDAWEEHRLLQRIGMALGAYARSLADQPEPPGVSEPATWCPQCGPRVAVDEDGCCASCGADAMGPGADQALAALRVAEPPGVMTREESIAFAIHIREALGICDPDVGRDDRPMALWCDDRPRWQELARLCFSLGARIPSSQGGAR